MIYLDKIQHLGLNMFHYYGVLMIYVSHYQGKTKQNMSEQVKSIDKN